MSVLCSASNWTKSSFRIVALEANNFKLKYTFFIRIKNNFIRIRGSFLLKIQEQIKNNLSVSRRTKSQIFKLK